MRPSLFVSLLYGKEEASSFVHGTDTESHEMQFISEARETDGIEGGGVGMGLWVRRGLESGSRGYTLRGMFFTFRGRDRGGQA